MIPDNKIARLAFQAISEEASARAKKIRGHRRLAAAGLGLGLAFEVAMLVLLNKFGAPVAPVAIGTITDALGMLGLSTYTNSLTFKINFNEGFALATQKTAESLDNLPESPAE